MGASIFMLVLSFLNNKLIYVFLSKSDNGVYFLFLRFSMLVSLVFGEWFRLSNVNIAGNDRDIIPDLSANNLWYTLSVCICLLLAVVAFSPVIEFLASGIPMKYIVASVVVGSAAMLRDSSLSILLVVKRMFRYGFTFVIWGTVAFVMNVVFLVIMKRGLDFAIVAWFIGILASAFWAYFSLASDGGLRMKPSLAVFSMSRSIGIRSWLAVLGMFIMINVNIFIIGPLTGNVEEGLAMIAVFSVCFRIFQLLQRVSNVGGMILLSHVVQEEKPKGFLMTMRVVRNIIFFSIVFCLMVLVAGKSVIRIISSSSYQVAYIPLLLLLPGIVAVNAGSIINNMYWGHGYPYKVILAPFAVTVVGVVLDIALLPVLGVSGVSLSFSVMGLLWCVYMVIVFRNDSGFPFHAILFPQREDVTQAISKIRLALSGGER